jgi:serine/threonine protein kinase
MDDKDYPEKTQTQQSSGRTTRMIGPYHLLQKIGEGGMGEVWVAEQHKPIHRRVALKLIKAGMDTKQVIARFESERQALAMMDHPAIAKVFEAGETDEGHPYFVMEYVQGIPITVHCDQNRLSTQARLELFELICEGVQHAHQKAVIHRDLKPSNILVAIQDGKAVPKIIDFGVAKATAQILTERTMYTELGMLIGTPEYMSPEQAEMSGQNVDTRTDVYSLGAILYELLVGALPFDPKELRRAGYDEIRRKIREEDPPKPSTRLSTMGSASALQAQNRQTEQPALIRQIRGDLDWITMKALEKDRTRRYGSPTELAADLRRHLCHEPVSAGPPSTVYRAKKFVRRHRFGMAAAAALVLLLVAFAVTMALQAQRIARERDRANREAERANREATAANQVSNFLVGLFKVSDPNAARGNSLTAREILDKGAKELEGSLRDQPEVQARLEQTIGVVYVGLGFYDQAQPLLLRAVETYRSVLGRDAPEALAAAHELANLYWYQNKVMEAESIYLEVAERRLRVLGEDHPDTLKVNYDMASLYLLQKRYDKFEPLALRTLKAQERVLGPEHLDTQRSLNNIQVMYYLQGRYAEAEPIAINCLEISRRTLGEDHPFTLRAAHNLATIYDIMGRYAQAEALYLSAIRTDIRVLGKTHVQTARTEAALASMYQRQGRFAESEPLALAVHEAYLATLGAQSKEVEASIKQLGELYAAWGKPEKAAIWRAKLSTLEKK